MPTQSDTIKATVRALRARPPDGLDDCSADGTRGVRVVETDAHRTYTVDLPTNKRRLDAAGNVWQPAPGSVSAAVIAEYGRQCERLACAEARVRAARLGTLDTDGQSEPIAIAVNCDADGCLCVTVAQPWTREQLAALRRLERQRAAQVELEELARGPQPAELRIMVRLDEAGNVDLDQLTEDPAVRAVVLAALSDDADPPDHPPEDRAP